MLPGPNSSMLGENKEVADTSLGKDKELLYTHPEYDIQLPKWLKYLDCYEAFDMERYLYTHLRETAEMHACRVRRGYYYNYVAAVVDLLVAYLYHSPILRELSSGQQPLFEELYEDADRTGNKYPFFMEMASCFSQICGHCGVLVDVPQAPIEGFMNEAERKSAGHRPYLTLVQATQIKDWELDIFGNFRWVKIETVHPQGRDWKTPVDEDTRYFLIWYTDHWQSWSYTEEKQTLLAEGENPLGEVPLVIIRNESVKRHPWFGLSSVRDIADINIAIFNWASLGDEEIFERCLNILTMEKSDDAPVEISHHNVLEFEAGMHPPSYLTPGNTPLEMIAKWMDRAKDEIYRLAHFGGSVGLLGVRQASSGIAYAYEFNETNQALAKKAKSLEQAELSIHRLVAKWQQEEFTGTITYPEEFGVEDFLIEFQILSEARTNLTSETAIKEVEKKLTDKFFSKDSVKLREKIIKEIEHSPLSVEGAMGQSFNKTPYQPYTAPGDKGEEQEPPPAKSGQTSKS